jgi:hypothetical protein
MTPEDRNKYIADCCGGSNHAEEYRKGGKGLKPGLPRLFERL